MKMVSLLKRLLNMLREVNNMKLTAKDDIIKIQDDKGNEIDLGDILNIEIEVKSPSWKEDVSSAKKRVLTVKIEVALTDLYVEGHSELFDEDVKMFTICSNCATIGCDCKERNDIKTNMLVGVRKLSDGKAYGLIDKARAVLVPNEKNKIMLQRYKTVQTEDPYNQYEVLVIDGEPQLTEYK